MVSIDKHPPSVYPLDIHGGVMAEAIRKWGNSQGVRISKKILKMAGLAVDDEVEISVSDGKVIIEKAVRKLTLEERIEKFGPLVVYDEIDWGQPQGSEVW